MQQNKRNAFRVEEAVRLQVEVIDDAEWQARLDMNAGSLASSNSRQADADDLSFEINRKLIEVKRNSASAGACLELINRKIDLLAEALKQLQIRDTDVYASPLRICNLSATGMRYTSRREFVSGQKLQLRFLLVADSSYFETLGTVTRSDAGENAGETIIAVEFVGMREGDRDILIRHLLNRQSETLRVRRLSSESMHEADSGEA